MTNISNSSASALTTLSTPSAFQNFGQTETPTYSDPAVQSFMDFMKESPGQQMEDIWLAQHHLTRADLAKMTPEQRNAIMQEMAQDIKQDAMKKAQSAQTAAPGSSSSKDPSTSTQTTQNTTARSSVPSTNNFSTTTLATLLDVQGGTAAVTPPGLALPLELPSSGISGASSASVTVDTTGPVETPNASDIAAQMMSDLGSNGVITLAQAEQALDGQPGTPTEASALAANPDATNVDLNSDVTIASDFSKLTGGTSQLNQAQLTAAVQSYINASASGAPQFQSVIL